MHWDIIKKAWTIASEKFPEAKRLFVDLPPKFRGFGECTVYDLETPEKPLGKISYEYRCEDGKPILSMNLQNAEAKTAAIQANMDLTISSSIQPFQKNNKIDSAAVMSQYKDANSLSEQVAYLVVGHDLGLSPDQDKSIDSEEIDDWIIEQGFPCDISAGVKSNITKLGFSCTAKRRKQKEFQNYQKVRVVDPRIMEYNEGARILKHKRDKDKNDWYEVIVDGSEKPIWLHEKQLAPNEVGSIADISSLDKDKK